MNFTASYLDFIGNKILDNLGHPIPTIEITKINTGFSFSPPGVVTDVFKVIRTQPSEDIRMIGLADLKELRL